MSIDTSTLPDAVRAFRPNCPGCSPKIVTEAGAQPCSTYDCPGLPAELRVTCDTCMYDFANDEGQVKCDQTSCETARRLLGNVETYRAWLEYISA